MSFYNGSESGYFKSIIGCIVRAVAINLVLVLTVGTRV